MRRRRVNALESIIVLLIEVVTLFIKIVFGILVFLYEVMTFYTSHYHIKSGNGFFKTYFDKGRYGEFRFYRKLTRIIPKKYLFTNIYLDGYNTETTEIDIIAISNKGIYIFEVKNYGGSIYGSNNNEYWTQVLNYRKKTPFYNPIKQNYAHIKAIEKCLNIENIKLVPVVVFNDRCNLTNLTVSADTSTVLYEKDTIRFVKSREKDFSPIISDYDCKEYAIKLIEK